jgi:hypothetical protein
MSATMHAAPDGLLIKAMAETTGGVVDLTGYAGLVYAPLQWGDGVRTATNGTTVDAIAADALAAVDVLNGAVKFPSLAQDLDTLASVHGITWAELFDALRYARAHGMI